jgi:hypothetical protein
VKSLITVSIILILIVVLVLNIIHGSVPARMMLEKGYLPRITAWACLLYGAYGLARSRFSFSLAFIFFFISFFLAYIGPFIPVLKEFY